MIYTKDIFLDSGAWALCRRHVLKLGKQEAKIGKHGRELEMPEVQGQGDFTYYDLTKGSPFRKYCDSYAAFVRKFQDRISLFANVDAIGSPELTWEIQRFFEEEHGLRLVPVVHFGADLKWVDKYVEHGYDIVGLGGFAKKIGRQDAIAWTDQVFLRLCPASNQFRPIIRVHGFAVTAWEYLVRWPFWSVDSTSWIKYSAYGWICLPRWTEGKGFRYDLPPLVVNMSWRSPFLADRNKHFNNSILPVKDTILRWLKEAGVPMGKADKEGNEIDPGVVTDHSYRSKANLHYYENLCKSLPAWPWPLSEKIRRRRSTTYQKGFGI